MATMIDTAGNAAAVLVDRHIAQSNGDRTALRYGAKRYAYHDVAALMNRAGNMLRQLGVEPHRHVLIAVPPSPACIASVLGTMKIGAVPVLVTRDAREKLVMIIGELDPPVIIAEAALATEIGSVAADRPVIVVGGDAPAERSFVELLRSSPSSLPCATIEEGAWAMAVLTASGLRHATHADVRKADQEGGIDLPAANGWNIGEVLAVFARGGEASLPG
jgi:acyl-coenzyme A synthetase/AMP-(fatty) acid ligase